jgi:Kef-type K+ transport system membrane component KefB
MPAVLHWSLPIVDPVLIMAVAMAIFLVAPLVMERARVPGLIGVILAGAIVGPNGLNLLARDQTIVLLGTVGLLYLIFLAGTAIDLHGFARYRNRSLTFGALSFLIPQVAGTVLGLLLGYSFAGSLLLGSMFGSHTLVAYPVAVRYGIAKSTAVTTAVGGTIVTDTASLLVLAVVAASTRGALDAHFWFRLVLALSAYVLLVWFGLPRLGRWFFRNERAGAVAEFAFILTALFGSAFLARVAGVQPIIGAFLAGLALNRLLPDRSLLANRLQFVGEAFFIPFFLLSVGMLADVRVLAGDLRVWVVMIAMTVGVTLFKGGAAKLAQTMFGYSADEGWTMAGLSIPQAAATLAVTLIGVQIGLLDDAVLNGAIMMIIVTCVVGPWLVEKYGRRLALHEEQKPYDPTTAPQRILVPVSNPKTAEDLMDLALVIQEPGSPEPIFPLAVVPAEQDGSTVLIASAEKMLHQVEAYGAAAGAEVVAMTRVDHNFASGIARGVAETRSSSIIVGWDGKRTQRRGIFGGVLDQLLVQTRQQIMVAKLGHPLNTTERVFLLIPNGSDHVLGFAEAVRTVKLLTNRLSARIVGYVVADDVETYARHFDVVKPSAPARFEASRSWPELLGLLAGRLKADDLVVVLSARRGAVSWTPALERLPARLADLVPESFVILYPSEVIAPLSASGGDGLIRLPAND